MANVDNTRKAKREQILINSRLILGCMLLIAIVLVVRLWYLQIVKGDYYNQRSQDNRIRTRRIRALRGLISDRQGRILADNSLAFNLQLIPENIDDIEPVARMLAGLLEDFDVEKTIRLWQTIPSSRRHQPLTLKKNLTTDELARVEARRYELPGTVIETEPLRQYPYDEICSHVIGYLGYINKKELTDPAYASYANDDLVGRSAIEAQFETSLRGRDGLRQVEVNARGRELSAYIVEPAQSGNNLRLSLDIDLQKLAYEAIGDEVGSVVAIDPDNGHILALVNKPSFSNNLFSTRISPTEWRLLNNDPGRPLHNRAIAGCYPPGSTFKPLTALLALQDHIITCNSTFFCDGAMELGRGNFRCWNRYGHGKVDVYKSLRESCDVFYYNLATRIAIDRIADFADNFAFGRLSGIELPEERSGLLPTSSWKLKKVHDQWYTGDTLSVVIGQGYMSCTPLQIAAFYAALANGGTYFPPRLQITDQVVAGLPIPAAPADIEIIRRALHQVVNHPRGTAYAYRVADKGWTMAGKTGTAQVVRQSLEDLDDKRVIPKRFRDHAWFAAFAPFNKPRIAIAVMIEHGGHGGSAAAPIAASIITYYLEQLLPGLEDS